MSANDAVCSWEDGKHRTGCQNVLCLMSHVFYHLSDEMFCTAGKNMTTSVVLPTLVICQNLDLTVTLDFLICHHKK